MLFLCIHQLLLIVFYMHPYMPIVYNNIQAWIFIYSFTYFLRLLQLQKWKEQKVHRPSYALVSFVL